MQLEEIIKRAFKHSTEAIMITDRNGQILEINQAAINLYGYSREELIGKNPRIFSSGLTPRTQYESMWTDILNPAVGYWRGEIVNRKKDGTLVPVLLSITPIKNDDGDITHYAGTALDLTEQKRLEREAQEKQAALAYIGQSSSSIVHDLTGPLTSIIGYSDHLLRNPELPAEIKGFLETIRRQGLRLSRQIGEITDIAKGDIELHYDEVNLREYLDEFVRDIKTRPYLKGISLTYEQVDVGSVRLDKNRIYRVLENLVKNSAEALRSISGQITITSSGNRETITIGIHDNGPGAPNSLQLFEFGATSGKEGKGSGIGLYTVKRIVELHRGTIEYKREDGITSFLLTLPRT